jgi:photosystem II stability/assembly factor-like uncharacterized protein
MLFIPIAVLTLSAATVRAQMNPDLWVLQDAHIPPGEMATVFSPVSEMVCWAVTQDTSNHPPTGYIRTTDGGTTWQYGRIPAAPDGLIWQIAAIDADTAYAAVWVERPSTSKGIYKTTNGGTTWRKLDVFASSTIGPAFVWFFDAANGLAVGDPRLETYTTSDGGEHWTPVTMYPYSNEITWNPAASRGNCAWFTTAAARVLRTTDRGRTWSASPRELQFNDWYPSLAFQDSATGIYAQKKVEQITPFQYRKTTDGGLSWHPLASSVLDSLAPTDVEHIPGTRATYLVAGGMQRGKRGLAVTTDAGESWRLLDTIGACFLGFASDRVGWCVPREHSHLLYKYVGPRFVVGVSPPFVALPDPFRLFQNYPNPFNPVTTIEYQLPRAGRVTLVVYDLLGREVARLVDGTEESGFKSITFDASSLASGIYLYRLRAGDFSQTRTMAVVK